jgi:6-pyruvoyltetrahydropterin/6-carboxytetrahydropterin synthase
MLSVGVRKTFDAAHRLQNHSGKCCNIHGHTYAVEVMVQSLSENGEIEGGVVIDFYDFKKALDVVLSDWDHSIILEKSDKLLRLLMDSGLGVCIITMENEPTVEHMAQHLVKKLKVVCEDNLLGIVSLRVYESPDCWAEVSF